MVMKQSALDKHTARVWDEFCEIYPKLCKFDPPKVRIDKRIKKALALNYWWKNTVRINAREFEKNIELFIAEILPHELAHQVHYNLHPKAVLRSVEKTVAKKAKKTDKHATHGLVWREIMLSYGLFPYETYHTK